MDNTSPRFIIREIEAVDIDSILELLKVCGLFNPEDDTRESFLKKMRIDKDLMLVAVVSDMVVGFIMGVYDGWAAAIWHLGVRPEFRNRGIADELMKEIKNRLRKRGASRVYGLVRTNNTQMRNLLSRFGLEKGPEVFTVTGQL